MIKTHCKTRLTIQFYLADHLIAFTIYDTYILNVHTPISAFRNRWNAETFPKAEIALLFFLVTHLLLYPFT